MSIIESVPTALQLLRKVTATIGAIDRAGAHAIEEKLCFAAKWSGIADSKLLCKVV
jgi:hypothetical protein